MEIQTDKLLEILKNKFNEIAAHVLGDESIIENGFDVIDCSAESLARIRVPFRAWMNRAGIIRREYDWSLSGRRPARAVSPVSVEQGFVTLGDFTMKDETHVLDVPVGIAERALVLGCFPDFKGERKKPELPIVRGPRNTSRYEGLSGVAPSEDGRRIVFKFLNGSSFSWSIVDKKFYHGNNGVEFAQSHFGNIMWGEAKPGCPTFFETLYKVADEGWVKNLFAILSNWISKNVQARRLRDGAYRLHERRLNRLDTMCDPKVIGPIESLAKNNFVDRMNLNRVCEHVFVGDRILAFSEVKEKYALDAWFLKHSGERVHPQYCRNERYADGNDLYADDNRDWILGNYMDEYQLWVQAGMSDLFHHVWEKYNFVFIQSSYQFSQLKDILNQLKGWGYDLKRVMDYLFYDLPMQGLTQTIITYGVPNELVILRDYAKMMIEMDRRYDRYPKTLKMNHDIATKNYKVQQSQVLAKKYEEVKADLKRYEWEDGKYVVIVPPTMSSVVQEGSNLNHCVASYVDGMVNREYAILFLRKKDSPEKSLVTLQVHGDNVSQARGQSNRATTDEEQEAIKSFTASLTKQKELDIVAA